MNKKPPLAERASLYICETFPHDITCALLGTDIASANRMRAQLHKLLKTAGIDTQPLRSLDAMDAALCALTAVADCLL